MPHPLLLLALATFIIVIGFIYWSKRSAKRHQETGGNTSGVGGPNDPLSGATSGIRGSDAMTAALDKPTGIDARPPV